MSTKRKTRPDRKFLTRLASDNVLLAVAEALMRSEPEARERASAALQAGDVRSRRDGDGVVIVVGGVDLAFISRGQLFASPCSPRPPGGPDDKPHTAGITR